MALFRAFERRTKGTTRLFVGEGGEGGDGCRVRVSPRTDTCQNDLTTGTEDGRAFPQVVEPLRGQSRTKLSWRIIVPRGVSRAAVQGASDLEHASKRGSDGSVSLPCAAVHHDPPRSTSIDRSIGPLIDRSIYESVARLNRFPLLPPFSPFCELQPFFYLATVDYFISTRCNDRVAAYRFLIRVNSRASNYSSSIDFLSFLAYVILFVHRYRVKFVVKIIEAWRIGRSARIRRNWFATRRIGHGRTQVFADGRIVEADLGSARLNPPPSPSFYPL